MQHISHLYNVHLCDAPILDQRLSIRFDGDRGQQARHKEYGAEDSVEMLMLNHSTSGIGMLWTPGPLDEDVAIAMMEMMSTEARMEGIA